MFRRFMSGGFGGMIMDDLCSRHDLACEIWLTKQKPIAASGKEIHMHNLGVSANGRNWPKDRLA